jgi:dipeptide transport system permease protein
VSGDAPDVLVVVDENAHLLDDSGERTIVARSPIQLLVMRFRRDRVAMTALAFIVVLVLVAVLAPVIIRIIGVPGPRLQNPDALDVFGTATGPGAEHPFGVDQLGRDILSRTVYGARVSLEAALIGTGLAMIVGTAIGLTAGFFGGVTDTLIMRLMDIILAFPSLLLALALVAILGPSLTNAMIAIALVQQPHYVRLARASLLSEKTKDYVTAARVAGVGPLRLMFRTILPNCMAPLIVQAALSFSNAILDAAALGFLGMGAQPPTPEWGTMLAEAREFILRAWWVVTFPGLAILITVLSINLMGDGMRDALDPRLKRS